MFLHRDCADQRYCRDRDVSLLPKSSTKLERDLERLLAGTCDMPLHIRQLWDPATCPAALLPWLAWANSVDDWQESWPESVKRSVIAAAFEVHRYKATPYALQAALDALGVSTQVVEWWEPGGTGVPGTQTITALLNDNIAGESEGLINAEMLRMISRTIYKTKRGSIHHDIELGLYFDEAIGLAAGRARPVALSSCDPESLPVTPGATDATAGLAMAEHRLTIADMTLSPAGVLPDEAAIQPGLAGGIHRITLHDTHLIGVI